MLSVLLLSSDYLCLNFLPFSFFLVGSVFLDNFAVSSWLSWADPSTLRAAWLRAFFLAFSFFLSFLVHNYKLSSFFFKNLKFDFQFPRYMSGDTLALSSVQRRIPPWSLPLWRRHLIAKKILFYPRAKNIPISSRLRTRTRALHSVLGVMGFAWRHRDNTPFWLVHLYHMTSILDSDWSTLYWLYITTTIRCEFTHNAVKVVSFETSLDR